LFLEFDVYSVLLPMVIERLGYPSPSFKKQLHEVIETVLDKRLLESKVV